MGLLVHLFSLQDEVTSPIILQVLLYSAALLVSCRAAQAHTLLGQPHYALTQWHTLDHVPKLTEALHVVAPIALSKWLSLWLQQGLCMPILLAAMYCYGSLEPCNTVVNKLPCVIISCHMHSIDCLIVNCNVTSIAQWRSFVAIPYHQL